MRSKRIFSLCCGWLIPALVAVPVILVACQSAGPMAATAPPAKGNPDSTIVANVAGMSTSLPAERPDGRLAYLGADGNVYVTTADRTSTVAITDDATTFPEGTGLSYHRISWSRDGKLAFAAVHRQGDDAMGKLFVVGDGIEGPLLVGESEGHFVIYVYWSPVKCTLASTCRLAYLIEEPESIALRLVNMGLAGVQNERVGLGWPYYFSWSPDGQDLLWHIGGARRDNPEAQLIRFEVAGKQMAAVGDGPGSYQAPAWSPAGASWLSVDGQGEVDLLQLVDPVEIRMLEAKTDRQFAFVWSPDATKVAFASRERADDPFYGPIHIHDIRSGVTRRITDLGFRIVGFFWAPDSARLGYLTWQEIPPNIWNQWRVFDLTTGQDRGFKSFHPSPQWRFVTSSFNQYAQSHRLWSPDGRFLVYADQAGEVERIWMIDTWSEDGTESIFVADGTIAFWSWN